MVMLARAILAITLLAAGGAKLADAGRFRQTLADLGLLKGASARVGALLIAAVEMAIGGLAIMALWMIIIDVLLLAMTSLFFAVAVFGALRRPGLACRCFGSLSMASFGARSVIRAGILLVLAVIVRFGDGGALSAYHVPTGIAAAMAAASLLFAAACTHAARGVEMVQRGAQAP